MVGGEKHVVDQAGGILHVGRIPWPQPAVDIDEGAVRVPDKRVFIDGRLDEKVLHRGVDLGKQIDQFLVRAVADSPQETGDRDFPAPVDFDRDDITIGSLKFKPGAAAWDQTGMAQGAAGGRVFLDSKIYTGGA